MKTHRTKKLGKLGLVVLVLAVCISIASATLLTHYGEERVTVNVRQAIVFDGMEDNSPVEHEFSIFGGCTRCIKEKIKNRGCIDGIVDFETTYCPDGDGITTTIYEVPIFTTLALNNKDSSWVEIDGDGIEGTLVFETVNPTFDYTFDAIGLAAETDYCLIYYADPWTGSNPGALIGTFTSDVGGAIAVVGSIDLGMNLPQPPDDNYLDGAKIWLVLASDYDEVANEMTGWNPDDYLFEHELVAYSDCNEMVECWLAPLLGTPIVDDLTVPANSYVQLIFCYEFAINIAPDVYVISTLAIPVLP